MATILPMSQRSIVPWWGDLRDWMTEEVDRSDPNDLVR